MGGWCGLASHLRSLGRLTPALVTASLLLAPGASASVTFTTGGPYTSAGNARAVTTADLNRDGLPDMVVTTSADKISVFLGTGAGAFGTKTDFATAASSVPVDAVTGDFNRDGKLDVVSANTTGLAVLLGNGDGSLQTHVDYVDGDIPQQLVTADFNRDGK